MTGTKRHLIAVLALAIVAAFAPSGAGATSCYPVPDPGCPPKRIPLGPLGSMDNPLYGPVNNAWPEMQLAIVGNQTFAGQAAFAPGDVTARWGGKLYIQNFTAESHIIAQVVNGTPCFAPCPQWNAVLAGPTSLGYFAASINIAPKRADGTGFERTTATSPKLYPFQCLLHDEMKGTLAAG